MGCILYEYVKTKSALNLNQFFFRIHVKKGIYVSSDLLDGQTSLIAISNWLAGRSRSSIYSFPDLKTIRASVRNWEVITFFRFIKYLQVYTHN